MDVKVGDEIYLTTRVYVGFTEMQHWEKVVVTRTTKTLIFIGKTKFRKLGFGINLFEINDETTCKATEYNNFLKHKELQNRFRNYKWNDVNLKTLMDINKILLLAEKHNELSRE